MDRSQHETRTRLRETWAGHILLDELHLAEMRAIIRAHLESTGTTREDVAREVAMTPRRLRAFLNGVELRERDWIEVARWCQGKPAPPVAPEMVALGVFSRWAYNGHVHEVRAAIARCVRAALAGNGPPLPPWTSEALDVL